ncbi:MAG: hypothetical protein IT432_02265 [Phycisphaerales bacterium]|nr:hypothetical protein [Phycisphaerales bacterium]
MTMCSGNILRVLGVMLTAAVACATASAQPWSFTKIVDTDTMVPGRSENFNIGDAFQSISVYGDRVAFRGRSHTGLTGAYEWRNGVGRAVADRTVALPRGGGNFNSVSAVSISATSVTFQGGNGSSVSGYYAENGTTLSRVVDTLDIAPERGIAFNGWGTDHHAEGDSVLFKGYTSTQTSFQGLYRNDGGTLSRVVDMTMSPPNRSDLFSRFYDWRLEGKTTYLTGETTLGYQGIFKHDGGVLSTLVDTTMSLSDGKKLIAVGDVRPYQQEIVFQAFTAPDHQFIASKSGDSIDILVDALSDPPGPSTGYQGINQIDYKSGTLVFGANDFAIYTNYGGQLQRVIGPGDVLNGKLVTGATFYEQGFDGTTAAFWVYFQGDSSFHYDRAIYTVTIPAPGAADLALIPVLALSSARRRRPPAP